MYRKEHESTMSVAETKKHFTQVLRKLKKPMIVLRHNEPVAVILSMKTYDRLSRMDTLKDILTLRHQLSKSPMSASQAYRLSRRELEERGNRNRH